jgi:Tol biopolymer transport system component
MKLIRALAFVFFTGLSALAQESLPAPWKHQDIGAGEVPGTADFAGGVLTLQGTMDLWGPADGCHFAWRPLHGDGELVARVTAMENPGGVGHAKASLCLRESLEPGSRSVTMCVTPGDGTQFLYRENKDEKTVRIFPDAEAQKVAVLKGQFPCWLKIVRQGNEFSGYESADGEKWELSGKITLPLAADTVIGLAASSHKKDILTKAVFDQIKFSSASPEAASKAVKKSRISQLTTLGIDGTEQRVVYQANEAIEAPNWSPDGKWLVFNAKGSIWRIAADGSGPPEQIPTGDIKGANNDHILSPDGKTIYFSAKGHIYGVPMEGGQPRRISNEQPPERKFQYFLHGVSPDGKTLVYAGVEAAGDDPFGRINLFAIPATGGPDTRLTDTSAPNDGPEYSPDGNWIYFNSEINAKEPGHAQCYRMKPDGTGIEQLTHDDRVNWFPHISPDGKWIVYISYPPGTVKHPPDRDVILRRMKPDGSEQSDITAFNGGQGTINVNSWAPDSKHFAFVAYVKAAE